MIIAKALKVVLKIVLMFAAVALLVPSFADAARPPISQAVADRAAQRELDFQVAGPYEDDGTAYPVGYALDPCEIERRQAYCDYSMTFSDGDVCDGTLEVYYVRRGRLTSEDSLDSCDSDDEWSGEA